MASTAFAQDRIERKRKIHDPIIADYRCKPIGDAFPSVVSELKENAFLIAPEDAKSLLINPAWKAFVGVLDLRDPYDWVTDQYGEKIPGALEFPIRDMHPQTPETKPIKGYEITPMDRLQKFGELTSIIPDTGFNENKQRTWQDEVNRTGSPFAKLVLKPVVIIHCLQSANRTPIFASGYYRYFAKPRDQLVLILEGGFAAYKKLDNNDYIEHRSRN